MISDCAKMIGITPEELMRSGMNVFWPSRMRPRPMTLRGIWMGMRRAATVTATVAPTTSTIIPSTTSSLGIVRSLPGVVTVSIVLRVSGQMRSTIEKKISRLMPFPMPRSVICSPSHMMNTPPAVSVSTVSNRNPNGFIVTAPGIWVSMNSEYPYDWNRHSTTVR